MKNSEKLTWQSSHGPLSVSVCSNVPEPKCFMSNGYPKVFITEFIQYSVSISTKSFSLLCEQYAPVFETLNRVAVSKRGQNHENQLAQILVDIQGAEGEDSEEEEDESRDIDLMTRDDEDDEEEIEPENEEDCAFLAD